MTGPGSGDPAPLPAASSSAEGLGEGGGSPGGACGPPVVFVGVGSSAFRFLELPSSRCMILFGIYTSLRPS